MDLKQACSICSTSGSSGEGRDRAIHWSSFLILTAGNGTFSPVMNSLNVFILDKGVQNFVVLGYIYPKCGYLILIVAIEAQ